MTQNDTEPLTTEWPKEPTDNEQAKQAIENLRLDVNEVMQHNKGLEPYHGQETDYDDYHRTLCRLYVEWALEHAEQLDGDRHPYKKQAVSDLKNIIMRLD